MESSKWWYEEGRKDERAVMTEVQDKLQYEGKEAMLSFADLPDPWLRIADVAERLGVEPEPDPGKASGWIIRLKDGRVYDVYKLMNAFLDRVDKALPKDD